MKKIFILYLVCMIGIFFIPVLFVKEYHEIEEGTYKQNINVSQITLLLSETNEIVKINLDDYIMGVIVGEMPVSYNLEALKAQAIVARTYTLNKILNSPGSHENADMCDNINHCQAYKTKEYALSCWEDKEENEKWNKIKTAVLETSDMVITYNGTLINAFFHANSGGKTEDIANIWGHERIPYLISVDSDEDELLDKVKISYADVDKIMSEKYPNYIKLLTNTQMDWNTNESNPELEKEEYGKSNLKILEKNSSGRVSKLQISNTVIEGTEARSLFGLRSTLFDIQFKGDGIIFETMGYGHGIGMSQEGANNMASKGANFEDIIKHYYSGVRIEKINNLDEKIKNE